MSFNISDYLSGKRGNKQNPIAMPAALENELAKLLKGEGEIGFAESCTGGYLSYLFTASTKLSEHFKGSIICYSPEVKTSILSVNKAVVKKQEAVNEECSTQMLQGLLKTIGCKYGVAVTGFAGPNGGTAKNPVGTIYISAGTTEKWITQRHVFYKTREENIPVFGIAALNLLAEFLRANK